MSLAGLMVLFLGLYYLIKGQIWTGGRVLRGVYARLLGLLLISGLFLPAAIGFLWALLRRSEGWELEAIRAEMRPYAHLINWGCFFVSIVAVMALSYLFGKPIAGAEAPQQNDQPGPASENPYEPPAS